VSRAGHGHHRSQAARELLDQVAAARLSKTRIALGLPPLRSEVEHDYRIRAAANRLIDSATRGCIL
jgi:hypothetical protein